MLLQAKHFVCGFGTFGYVIAFLNKNLEAVYIPDYCERFFDNSITQFKVNKIRIKNYIKLGQWKATSKQIALMKSHSINNISSI